MTGQKVAEPPKSRRPGGEHLRAAGRLVVRHLRRHARPEQVRDLRDAPACPEGTAATSRRSRCRSRRRTGRTTTVNEPCARPEPRRQGAVRDGEQPLLLAVVVGPVLHADQSRLGTAGIAPLADLTQHLAVLLDLPEEVVRREEHQVAAEVAEPLHDVVLVRRHVLRRALRRRRSRMRGRDASPFAIRSKSESEMNSALLPDQNSQCRNGRSYR